MIQCTTFIIIIIATALALFYHKYRNPYIWKNLAVKRIECELGVISDAECPIDGSWSMWGSWSPCKGSCDDIGQHTRTRLCNNPSPSENGMPCIGPDEQSQPCFMANCTVEDFRKLVAGDAIRTEAFRQLETVPALMDRCLQTDCPYDAIVAALKFDNTWQINPETIWNSLLCVKQNIGCALMGEWGPWGKWSSCGARCGRGLRWRLRRCDTPPPSDEYLVCPGTPLQSEECEGDQCAIDDDTSESSPGTWRDWGPWSTCSEKCGAGVRRRRRFCDEHYTPSASILWGTHCRGQHDELQVCENKDCTLNGGWSGWGPWGPCSQSCGPGKRSRSRSCTRPVPSTDGADCVGQKVEVSTCNLAPCEVFIHNVAVFNGESVLRYKFNYLHSILFHFYIRFLPLSPHGTLVRRGSIQNPLVRLSMQQWHVCLDARGTSKSCLLPRICSLSIVEPAAWHSVLITVTNEGATLRLDDAIMSLRQKFPCDPELPDMNMNITVGERFHGAVQEIILNFTPLRLFAAKVQQGSPSYVPSEASNIAFERANIEEGFIELKDDSYMRIPCFENQGEWRLQISMKPNVETGTLLFLEDIKSGNWLHIALQNLRLKMYLMMDNLKSESSSISEVTQDQWLDVSVSKKRESNAIEAIINSREKLHVLLPVIKQEIIESISYHKSNQSIKRQYNDGICSNEFYVGNLPDDVKSKMNEAVSPFSGVIALFKINDELQDLRSFSIERNKDYKVQVSSRTASISGSYHETTWGMSNRLNLTCLHARAKPSPHSAQWLFLDTMIDEALKGKTIRSIDDGRVLRLVASVDNELRGFYSCRAHSNRRTRNIVTYGILGQLPLYLSGTNAITAFAAVTTLTLVVGTLSWLVYEGIDDLRNGFGFFRDADFSPQGEAEAVCRYIDKNAHLFASKSAVKMAKARARRKGHQMAKKYSFNRETQILHRVDSPSTSECDLLEHELPALPAIKSTIEESSHEVYRCEPSFFSSPRHGSIISTTPRGKLDSSSSFISANVLCSHFILSRVVSSSRESTTSKRALRHNKINSALVGYRIKKPLLTIKSSTYVNMSAAQKVLRKFQELKSED